MKGAGDTGLRSILPAAASSISSSATTSGSRYFYCIFDLKLIFAFLPRLRIFGESHENKSWFSLFVDEIGRRG